MIRCRKGLKSFLSCSALLLLLSGSLLPLTGCKGTQTTTQATTATTQSSAEATTLSSVEVTTQAIDSLSSESSTGITTDNTVRGDLASLDYSDSTNWAYLGESVEESDKAIDVFFIAPTNVMGDEDHLMADLNDENDKKRILAAIGMQTGIYNETGRFYAPYYRQITMKAYEASAEDNEAYLQAAYQDVKEAFDWYMENENDGRPFIIAGFSQGADHGKRLLKEYGADSDFAEKLVAAYLIGWRVTDDDLQEAPYLKMAQSETDTGVIIAFDCEAEDVDDTLVVPKGSFTYSINPLNWKTDSTPASKEENLGYVYPASDGSVKKEIPNLCGAVIDPERGTIKVNDVSPEDYPAILSIFPEGSYHIYDYEFYYRNLQENVKVRTESYLQEQ